MRRATILLFALAGCGGISDQQLAKIKSCATLTSLGYHRQDAGTAGAADDRVAFCACNSVLRDVDAGIDGGVPGCP